MGTSFTLNDKLFLKPKTKEEEELASCELEYDIQSKIVNAVLKLANEELTRKSVRKQRKMTHQKEVAKLKLIEQKLATVRKKVNASRIAKQQRRKKEDLNGEDNDERFHDAQHRTRSENIRNIRKRSSTMPSNKAVPVSTPENPRTNNYTTCKMQQTNRPLSPPISTSFVPINNSELQTKRQSQRVRSASVAARFCKEDEELYDLNKSSLTVNVNITNYYQKGSPTRSSGENNSAVFHPNGYCDSVQDENNLYRSNSLENFVKGYFSRRQRSSNSDTWYHENFSSDNHHQHYHNHYPAFRRSSKTNLQLSPNETINDTFNGITNNSNNPPKRPVPPPPPINSPQRPLPIPPKPIPVPLPLSPTLSGLPVDVVSIGNFKPYWEEEKPYELSDFYKYSAKHRKKASEANLF